MARRLARDNHINLTNTRGSGPYGRVVKADVERIIAATAVVIMPLQEELTQQLTAPSVVATKTPFDIPHKRVPHTAIRKTIAHRMIESVRNIPHFTLTMDFEIDALTALRFDLNTSLADGENNSTRHLSINDFLVKACAVALRKVPDINACFTEEAILYYEQINVAIAVNTQAGLVAPVVHDTDRKGLIDISSEIGSLVHRARAGRLHPKDCLGGTFTLSNLGQSGIRHFSAIINPPQTCILAIGTAEPRPVVHQGALTVATVMTGTLSADHRVIDGATGANYLIALRKLIERPLTMLL